MIKTQQATETAAKPTDTVVKIESKPVVAAERQAPRGMAAKAKPKAQAVASAVPHAQKSSIVKAAPKQAGTPEAATMPTAKKEDGQIEKPKLISDQFTMLEAEYKMLGDVKKACIKAGFPVKKNELLQAGIMLLKSMDMADLKRALAALPRLEPGRSKKNK